MGTRFLTETVYAGRVPVNPPAMVETLTRMLASDTAAVFVADHDRAVTGMIGVLCYAHPFTGWILTQELFWWVEPERRGYDGIRLLMHAESWARDQGSEQLLMIAPTPDIERLYQRLGYRYLETNYLKVLAA